MDQVEAKRNLREYQESVEGLKKVHPQHLNFDELNAVTNVIKRLNQLSKNIEDQLDMRRTGNLISQKGLNNGM